MEQISGSINVKQQVGDLEILASNFLHLSGGKIATIKVSVLTIKISFSQDSTTKETRYISTPDGMTLNLELINFSNTLGEGLLEPLFIGHLSNRKIYLSFFVNTIDVEKGLRTLSYSLYLGGNKDE